MEQWAGFTRLIPLPTHFMNAMHENHHFPVDSKLDLSITRHTDLAPELVWKAWTTPEFLMKWFCPKPYKVSECEIDLRPGGRFWNVMESPEGSRFPGEACYLEILENRRLVWTSSLLHGFRPKAQIDAESGMNIFGFTAIIELVPHESGTTYKATVVHATEEDRAKHEAMGFETGWGLAFDQLVQLMSLQSTV